MNLGIVVKYVLKVLKLKGDKLIVRRDIDEMMNMIGIQLDLMAIHKCPQRAALLIKLYFDELIKLGFSRTEAIELCKGFSSDSNVNKR